MTVHQPFAKFQEDARIGDAHDAVPLRRNRGERTFELHPGVHAMVITAYFAFAGILCTAFMGKDLILPAAICAIGIASLFITPALWARVKPDDGLRKQSWAEFMQEGVECITGRLTAGQALAQILVLPSLMVALAFVFAIVKATL
jgi:Flp pilus assembly protein TadB